MMASEPQLYTIARLLSAKRHPDHLVAFDAGQEYSWQGFKAHVSYMAQRLNQSQADKVALCFKDSYQFAVAFIAACYSGKHILLPTNYQPQALNSLAQEWDLLLHDELLDPAKLNLHCMKLRLSLVAQKKTVSSTKSGSLTLFTSGSTEAPKAIDKTLAQLDSEIAILESLWGALLQQAQIQSTVSHQHIYGLLFRVLWPLCSGRAFAANNLFYPEQLSQQLEASTVLITSPALLKRLGDEEQKVTQITACFSSGGALPSDAANHANTLFGSYPIEIFGSTETGGIAYRQQTTALKAWTVFPKVKARLGSEDCLQVKGKHINGDAWYQTTDLCHFYDASHFDLLGRADRVVKIEEKRISLPEVEQRLTQLDWVEDAAVFALQRGNRLSLCAVLVLSAEGKAQLTCLGRGKFWLHLRTKLRQWLEPLAIPRRFRVLNEIPLNSQSKRQLEEMKRLF